MATKASCSAAVPSGDTTKTTIATITTPADAKRIVAITQNHAGGATVTTAETISGMLELESEDMGITPLQIPFAQVACLVSPALAQIPPFPVDIPLPKQVRILGSVTMDMAQTGAITSRFGLVYDV